MDLEARLLLLSPSRGFGGGIERVAAAVEQAWEGPVDRVDLYRFGRESVASGNRRAKARFGIAALLTAARTRPDVVLCLHVGQLAVGVAAGWIGGARSAIFGMGIEVWTPMDAVTSFLVRRCRYRLGISAFTAEWMARRARMDASEVQVIPLPVERQFAEAAENAVGSRRLHGMNILTVCTLLPGTRYKGYFTVARSLPRLLNRYPELRWTVVGKGSDVRELVVLCEHLGIGGAVRVLDGAGDDALLQAYSEADIFVLPSVANPDAQPPTGEGFGLVFAEAACLGVPSVASSAGGGSLEFVMDGRTGLTVPPDDPGALAQAIGQLLEDPSLRDALGERARQLVLTRHHPQAFRTALRSALSA